MAQWKLGYPSGLGTVANEAAGRELYAGWSIVPITLSSKSPLHALYAAQSASTSYIVGTGASHSSNDVQGGMMKVNSGAGKGFISKITSNTSSQFNTSGVSPFRPTTDGGVAAGNVFEVATGEATYAFAVGRNPQRHDYKMVIRESSQRMPYTTGGYQFALGREPDDFNISAMFSDLDEFNQLMILLSNPVGYDGCPTQVTNGMTAPLILEQGTHDADHQYLVYYRGFEITKQSAKGTALEVSFEFEQLGVPSFRGI